MPIRRVNGLKFGQSYKINNIKQMIFRPTFHSSVSSVSLTSPWSGRSSIDMIKNLSLIKDALACCSDDSTTLMNLFALAGTMPLLGRTRNLSGDVVLIYTQNTNTIPSANLDCKYKEIFKRNFDNTLTPIAHSP